MEERIAALLCKMTLEEKISLLAGVDNWHTRPVKRLGIPAIKVTDGPHGARTADESNPNETLPATCFPTGVALAATWNTDLIKKVGVALGKETRARGCSVLLGPCVNIHRSPLGGRNFESYSEDPCLSSRLAVAIVSGIQSRKVSVCVKHFALNNQEYQRMTISSDVSERAMREIYFPSFAKAVKEAGAWAVMCSYNRVNGVYASANRRLLTDLLKGEWGFEGLVMSDWFAVHSTVPAAKAGLDLEMPGPALYFNETLLEAVKQGQVPVDIIDDKVRRLLRLMFNTGAFEEDIKVAGAVKDFPAHRRLARAAAEEAIVLLKNERNVLPLDRKSVRTIAVIGPQAAVAGIQGGGSAEVRPYYKVSPLAALQKLCGDKVKIIYELGCPSNIYTLPLDPACLISAKGSKKPGLTAAYYGNSDFVGKPALTRVDTDFDFRWTPDAPPVECSGGTDFSVRWQGIFKAPETGLFRFGLAANGWGRLYIDDTLVCGNWGERRGGADFHVTESTGEYAMKSGRSYAIKIEFRKNDFEQFPRRSIRIGCDLPRPDDLLERAAKAAAGADVAIVFTGLTEEYESEGFDRKNMDLPPGQSALIRAVAKANPNTVVVLNNGAPVTMADWIDDVPAVVDALFPGQEGGNAVAAVLFGDVNPSGKLPDTYPRRLEDNPVFINYPGESGKVLYGEGIYVGYRYYDAKKVEPLFPFGHGLSYTGFKYGNLKVSPAKAKVGQKIAVSIDITNTGQTAGKEVVQLYVSDVVCRLARPPRELKAFKKIRLASGATQTVTFTLDDEVFSFYDPALKDWTVEPGDFEILVGSSSRDIRAKKTVSLDA
ncbi:MAG: glycoside hydrolase family 3 C-terminal domain-containing protein [Dehalococcoidales bacterium]|jgi:beta-glucosidase